MTVPARSDSPTVDGVAVEDTGEPCRSFVRRASDACRPSRIAILMHRLAQHGPVWRRAAIVVSLCLVLAAAASSAGLHDALLQVLATLEELIDSHVFAGAALFVVLAAVGAMFTFVSTAVLVPAAVFAWGEIPSMSLLWTGWVLGGLATYGIGRGFGRPVADWLSVNGALQRFEHRVHRHTRFWLVVLLQLALPSEIPGYLLGFIKYPLSRYILALGIAELPYTVATVRLGASFVAGQSRVILAAGISIALLSLAAFYVLHHVTREKSAANSVSGVS
jgi:uncharacterized membrane protein YdjX (TVP38/TMEM64 family)